MDGGNFVDDFVEILKNGNNEEAGTQVYMKLFSEKVPGTDDTYIQRILAIQQDINKSLKTLFNDDQWKAYQHSGQDPLKIETGHDPWADYFRSKGVEDPDG